MPTSRVRPSLAFVLIVCVSCGIVALGAQAPGSTPLDAYRTFLGVMAKAKTPDPLLPFVSAEFKSLLQNGPKTEIEKMIAMHVAKDKLSDITVVSQKVDAAKAVLELKAKTGDGRDATGKVTMVQEGGAWKTDEDAWAIPTKK